jgi:hypothetical protein
VRASAGPGALHDAKSRMRPGCSRIPSSATSSARGPAHHHDRRRFDAAASLLGRPHPDRHRSARAGAARHLASEGDLSRRLCRQEASFACGKQRIFIDLAGSCLLAGMRTSGARSGSTTSPVPCDSFWKSGPSLPTLSESSHNRPPTYLTPIPLRRTRVSRAASRPHTN